jgi:predicted ArsR family transcriptional regulator
VTHSEKPVYTVLIQQLSDELAIPESTVRWNLKGLREAELIRAGTKDNKGVPVSLTAMGRIMAGCAPASMD